MTNDRHPTLDRLEDQIAWYDRKSAWNQRWYKWLKVLTIVISACLPLIAALTAPLVFGGVTLPDVRVLIGVLGVVIVIVEALQQLNQFQQNWIAYRSTAEALKHEKYLFLAAAPPYRLDEADRLSLLAERVESLVSQEHAKWVTARKDDKPSE